MAKKEEQIFVGIDDQVIELTGKEKEAFLEQREKDIAEEKIKFSCKGIQKNGNNVNYQKFKDVLFNGVKDTVLNKGFRYVEGTMKSYEQQKKGLSYCYHKRIVCEDGISTKPLNI